MLTRANGGPSSLRNLVWRIHTLAALGTILSLALLPCGCKEPGEGTTDPTARASASLQAAPDLAAFAIYATNSARVEQQATISSGSVGVERAGKGPFLYRNAELRIDSKAEVHTSFSLFADSLSLTSGAVAGDVFTNDLEAHQNARFGKVMALPTMPSIPAPAPVVIGTMTSSSRGSWRWVEEAGTRPSW